MTTTTYWGRTQFPPGNDAASPPWVLREIEGKGFAAFATRRFEMGELICTELPTVWAPGHHPFSAAQVAEIEARVSGLGDEERGAFYAMANVFPVPDAATRAAGIFMTNAFDMTDSPHGEACAMYLALARLNHSCTPNAQQTHLPDTGEEVLYASRAIEAGEEINDCYIELRQPAARRRAELADLYRFDCSCPACCCLGAEAGTDDANRTRAAQLDDLVVDVAAESGPARALDVALQAVRLLTAPENLPWSARYVADAHLSVYQLCEALDKRELARKHIAAALEMNLLLQGPRSPVSKTIISRKALR